MKKRRERSAGPDQSELPEHRLRLPGFITDEEIGLGDVMKRATSYLGVASCSGCERRTAALNRWLVFHNKRE